MRKKTLPLLALLLFGGASLAQAQDFKLTENGYFQNQGVDVMAFDDIYPEGHQGGVSIIMNGHRVATNGDIRLEATPGQWQPVPKQLNRELGENSITAELCYPDSTRHLTGFSPIIYPDLNFNYKVRVEAVGKNIEVTVDLDRPIPEKYIGKVGFNFEFFPGSLFGKPWLMDDKGGIYPQQPNAPLATASENVRDMAKFKNENKSIIDIDHVLADPLSPIISDGVIAEPYAVGRKFTSRPDDAYTRVTIESLTGDLKLYDGRMNHNNGWFVLRSEIAPNTTKGAVKWIISPEVVEDWTYTPVVQTSQIGYHPAQQKTAIIELDSRDKTSHTAKLYRIEAKGEILVSKIEPHKWGKFLRYNYLEVDFSDVKEEGIYRVKYGASTSPIFRIASDVYDRGVWQPVLEYFLPVQMCHMRVNEKYRVWHAHCHHDDARMAPAFNHFDGYDQKEGYTKYKAGDRVEGVNVGGWHDAGDFDLRIESQSGESYILALAYEAFKPEIDVTSIDQHKQVTEIHLSDNKNDLLQQVENGAISVIAGYKALGRLYRGIICPDLRQYVMLGDAAAMTDGIKGNEDDRWIFTENNPPRELTTAAELAATSRVLKGFNDTLSNDAIRISRELYDVTDASGALVPKIHAAAELYLTTSEDKYLDFILDNQKAITENIDRTAWFMARVAKKIEGMKGAKAKRFTRAFRSALKVQSASINAQSAETPYGIPYKPNIWGAGWGIQRFGVEQYFLVKDYPELFSTAPVFDALHFVLGCHPGINRSSFASGVGAESATVGYGLNRADWSYIPGGVISGTALIRPDFPELLVFPYLWQQTEYVLGGGSSNYMFLVLASQQLLGK